MSAQWQGRSALKEGSFIRVVAGGVGHEWSRCRVFQGGIGMHVTWSRRALVAASVLILVGALVASVIVALNVTRAHGASALPGEYFAPYQDVTIGGASLQSVAQSTRQKYYTLAFIDGNGCDAEWGGRIPLDQVSSRMPHLESDIAALRNQGGDVIISFGGGGQELALSCSDASTIQAQYQRVITQYSVTHLDFDIEGGAQGDQVSYDRRNSALAALQRANPGLNISFTLPTSPSGLLGDSLGLLNNAITHGVNFRLVNIMTMDYAVPNSQMGQATISAANNLHRQLQQLFPARSASQLWSMIGITVMIGQNDSAGEIFSLNNATEVLKFAQAQHIGELSFWEASRDNGNCAGSTSASAGCSGLAQSQYAFTNLWEGFSNGSISCNSFTGTVHIINRHSGKYLDVQNRSTNDLVRIIQDASNGQADQEWSFQDAGGGYCKIMNRNSKKLLNIPGPSTVRGTPLIQYHDDNKSNSQWKLVAVGAYYTIVSRYDGQYLDVNGDSTANGAAAVQWSNNGQPDQQWQIITG